MRIQGLEKVYSNGQRALESVNLEIARGELFALLGPNGAGKTTLIGLVCGLVKRSGGTIEVDGVDIDADPKRIRQKIGLVPQELSTDMFETVIDTVRFSRGLFGRPKDDALIERVLRDLSLWEKRSAKIMTLSGGMKRRVLIAKALSHEPSLLFLDEPTAGVDVELRRDMWSLMGELRTRGVTIILTTHYIEEAEQMADRIGVMRKGKIILVEEKNRLMKQLGKKELRLELFEPLAALPAELERLELSTDGLVLAYNYDKHSTETGIVPLLREVDRLGIQVKDMRTLESSLEDIFVDLVHEPSPPPDRNQSPPHQEISRV